MTPLFKKMNHKGQTPLVVFRAPDSFVPETEAISRTATVLADWPTDGTVDFALAFATKQSEVDAIAHDFDRHTVGDAVLWIAYPKGSSKRYRCDFNRDTGWAVLGQMGFEPVRQVAIDEDWSALRFRRVAFIKTMTRSFAMTEEGKKKTAKGGE